MRLRIVSDLHLEFTPIDLQPHAEDKDSVLVLAGDVGNFAKNKDVTVNHFKKWSQQFKIVLYVLGNHDYYYGCITSAVQHARNELQPFENVHVLHHDVFHYDNVCFIGATLWTDFKNSDPTSMNFCQYAMADYKYISHGDRQLRPSDTLREHQHHRFFIFEQAKHAKVNNKHVVVISHHLPSYKSVHPFYAGSDLNCAFATNLDNEIEHSDIDLWIHGHTHYCFDYRLGNTRIFCNPRGYVIGNRVENPDFDPHASINIGV